MPFIIPFTDAYDDCGAVEREIMLECDAIEFRTEEAEQELRRSRISNDTRKGDRL